MTRSRLVVLGSALVVGAGALAAVGALYLDPARAAVGPLPPQALSLPAGTRYVMGLDVKRFVASPLYTRFAAAREANRPRAFEELEAKTGLNPERDVDQVYIAGSQAGAPGRGGDPLVVVTGRFDRAKVARAIETEKKGVTSKNVQGHRGVPLQRGPGRPRLGGRGVPGRQHARDGQPGQRRADGRRAREGRGPAARERRRCSRCWRAVKPGSTFWMVGDQTPAQQHAQEPSPAWAGRARARASSCPR